MRSKQKSFEKVVSHKQSIALGTIILLAANILKSASMLINNVLIAAIFGATYLTDGFFLAYLITVRFGLALSLCVNFVLIPNLAKFNEKMGKKEVGALVSSFFNNILVLAVGGTALFFLAVPWIITLFSEIGRHFGFSMDEATLGVIINNTRALAPTLLLFMAYSLYQAYLYSHKQFLVPALGSLLPSIGIIAGAIFLSKSYGIYSLAIGVILGSLLQVLSQLPAAKAKGLKYTPVMKWRQPDILRMRRDVELMVLIVALSQVVVTLDKFFASTLDEGSVSALTFAGTILRLAPTLLHFSLLSSALPTLTEYIAQDDWSGFQILFNRLLRLIGLLMVPVTVLFFIVGLPVVQLIYEHGKFSAEASLLTYSAIQYYAIGFFAFALQGPFIQALYVLRKFAFILIWTIITIFFTTLLNYLFMSWMGFKGLPLAYSIIMFIHLVACYLVMRRYVPDFKLIRAGREFTIMLAAGFVMFLSVKGSYGLVITYLPLEGVIALFLKIILPSLVGTLVYLTTLFIFRSHDLGLLLNKIGSLSARNTAQE